VQIGGVQFRFVVAVNFGPKSPERGFAKRGIFGWALGPLGCDSLDPARTACRCPGATNCLGPSHGCGPNDFGQSRASQALLAQWPSGRRHGGWQVELEIGHRVRNVCQEQADLGVPQAHGEIQSDVAGLMRRHRDWSGGSGAAHPGVRQPHRRSAGRGPDARGHPEARKAATRFRAGCSFLHGNLAKAQGRWGVSGRFTFASDTRPRAHRAGAAPTAGCARSVRVQTQALAMVPACVDAAGHQRQSLRGMRWPCAGCSGSSSQPRPGWRGYTLSGNPVRGSRSGRRGPCAA
jgi:hypothetical protein